MENNSDVHDKREATHFRRQRANGKVGVLPLAGKNKSCLISSLAAHLPTKKTVEVLKINVEFQKR